MTFATQDQIISLLLRKRKVSLPIDVSQARELSYALNSWGFSVQRQATCCGLRLADFKVWLKFGGKSFVAEHFTQWINSHSESRWTNSLLEQSQLICHRAETLLAGRPSCALGPCSRSSVYAVLVGDRTVFSEQPCSLCRRSSKRLSNAVSPWPESGALTVDTSPLPAAAPSPALDAVGREGDSPLAQSPLQSPSRSLCSPVSPPLPLTASTPAGQARSSRLAVPSGRTSTADNDAGYYTGTRGAGKSMRSMSCATAASMLGRHPDQHNLTVLYVLTPDEVRWKVGVTCAFREVLLLTLIWEERCAIVHEQPVKRFCKRLLERLLRYELADFHEAGDLFEGCSAEHVLKVVERCSRNFCIPQTTSAPSDAATSEAPSKLRPDS